jgi:predicted regulator of Ras-like GTPase activity (Roadblock/LC7/MglB family)
MKRHIKKSPVKSKPVQAKKERQTGKRVNTPVPVIAETNHNLSNQEESEMAEQELQKRLTDLLRGFQAAAPGVLGSAVISADGFAIASELPGSVQERTVSAMAAAMLALGEQTTSEFEHGRLERVFVEGKDGITILMNAGTDSVLSAVTRKDAKLGLVFMQMERAAESIRIAMS